MKKLIFPFLLCFYFIALNSISYSSEMRVLKVKGNKATIQFRGTSLKEKETYNISEKEADDYDELKSPSMGYSASSAQSRNYGLGLDVSFSSISSRITDGVESDSSPSTTLLNAAFHFGFNIADGMFEVGPIVNFATSNSRGDSLTVYTLGAFATFHFIKNNPKNNTIPGLSVTAGYSGSSSSKSKGNNPSGFSITPSLQLLLFALGNDTALRLFAGYTYQVLSVSGLRLTTTGIITGAGLNIYF